MFFPLKDNMPKATFPLVTAGLIALNALIYFMASSDPLAAQDTAIFYGVIPYEVMNPGTQCVPAEDLSRMVCGTDAEIRAMYPMIELPATWVTVATSMFLHGGLFHLLSNMLFLFVFGGALENALGRLSFGMFYLVGGVAAVLGQTLWDAAGTTPMVGASGAIAAVLAGYMVIFPSAKILSLLVIIPMRIRAFWVIGTWIGFQFADAYVAAGEGGSGGVAYWAHIGGFAAGIALTYLIVTSDQIAAFRREARVVSGYMVEPPVPYVPEAAGVPPEINRYLPPPHPRVHQDPFAMPPPQAQRPPAA